MRLFRSVLITASCAAALVGSPCAGKETLEGTSVYFVTTAIWAMHCGGKLGPRTAAALKNAKDFLHLTDNPTATAAMEMRAMRDFHTFSGREELEYCVALGQIYTK